MTQGEKTRSVQPGVRLVLSGYSLAAPDAQEVFVKLTHLGASWKWTKETSGVWEVPGASLREALALSPTLTIAGVAVPFEPSSEGPSSSERNRAEPSRSAMRDMAPVETVQATTQEGDIIEVAPPEAGWDAANLYWNRREEAWRCVESVVRHNLDQMLATANDPSSSFRITVGRVLAEYVASLISETESGPLLSTMEGKGRSWPLLVRWPVLIVLLDARPPKIDLMRKALAELNQEFVGAVNEQEKDQQALEDMVVGGVDVLVNWGDDAHQCLPHLLELLRNVYSPEGERSLLQAVQAIATDEDTEAIDAIIEVMGDADHSGEGDTGERCAQVLAAIGRLNALQRLLRDIQWTYHDGDDFLSLSFYRNFTDALGGVAQSVGGAAVPLLLGALSEKVGVASQIAATRALARLGSVARAALPNLHTLLGHDSELDREIRAALQRITPGG